MSRLFFALYPDDFIRQKILHATGRLDRVMEGKVVAARNFHMTLVFVGPVDEQKQQSLVRAANTLSLPAPFEVVINRVGSFKRIALWLGPGLIPEPLLALHQSLNAALKSQCGFQPERRAYKPHITIQRKIIKPQGEIDWCESFVWPVNSFSLMRSESGKNGVIYHELRRWSLSEKSSG